MLTEAEILKFIQDDASSKKKRFARIGQRYYEGEHDILRYKLYYTNADGELVEDTNRSNIKISHPFFTELIDQAVQYMLSGKNGFVRSDIPELQSELDSYFNENEDFTAELYETLTGCLVKGSEYIYVYMGKNKRITFQHADSMGIVEVSGKETSDGRDYVIYCCVDHVDKNGIPIKKIQVWDDRQVSFYIQKGNGALLTDDSEKINPRPHILYTQDKDSTIYCDTFGFVPFFRIDSCKKQTSTLKPIKTLIDDYDLMSCALSNNLQDFDTPVHVVRGFQGDNLDELINNIRTKKHIGVDESGGVDVMTVDIPYQARQAKLELDEKNIYRFGMGFNSAQLGDGNVTNVVIKSRYALLDLKCNKLEIRLKQLLRKLLKIVLDEINHINGTDYRQKDVYFRFEREVMTNASDNAQIEQTKAQTEQTRINTLLGLFEILGDKIIVQSICEALDIDYEAVKGSLPANELDEVQKALSEAAVDE